VLERDDGEEVVGPPLSAKVRVAEGRVVAVAFLLFRMVYEISPDLLCRGGAVAFLGSLEDCERPARAHPVVSRIENSEFFVRSNGAGSNYKDFPHFHKESTVGGGFVHIVVDVSSS
jgi:hypothetical protein